MNSMELMIRTYSVPSIRTASQASLLFSEGFPDAEDVSWSWAHIKRQFQLKKAELIFNKYQARLQHSLFVLLLLLNLAHSFFSATLYFTIASGQLDKATVALTLRVISIVIYISFLSGAHKEKLFRSDLSRIVVSIVTLVVMFLTSHGSVIYQLYSEQRCEKGVRPTYYVIMVTYIMLPFPRKLYCTIAGSIVIGLELFFTGHCNDECKEYKFFQWNLISDAMFYLVGGAVGLYIRFLLEMMNRKAFLDRRECLESKIKLGFEKQQQDRLLLSVLPDHLADQVKNDIRTVILRLEKRAFPRRTFNELYVERHGDVTILYADIVNSMKLTAQLNARELVETLNELFARFDESAEENRCIRIKLLGDCYYCVSGVPKPDPNNADNCVKMGLNMIEIIKKIREDRDCDVDMRIGVHTGSILGGLIGSRKWQYDIWSKDALIASHMEQAGKPGHVHITDVTFKQLQGQYFIMAGDAHIKDPYLSNAHLENTYLISPIPFSKRDSFMHDNKVASPVHFIRNSVPTSSPVLKTHLKSHSVSTVKKLSLTPSRKKTVLDYSISQYRTMVNDVKMDMEKAIEAMALSKRDQWCGSEDIHPLFLTFINRKYEKMYILQSDPLFKYYMICILVLFCGTLVIHSLALPWDTFSWVGYSITFLIIILGNITTWGGYIWSTREARKTDNRPYHYSNSVLTRVSHYVNNGLPIRILIWFITSALMLSIAMTGVEDCAYAKCVKKIGNTILEESGENKTINCLNPWYYTFNAAFAMTTTSVFLRINFLLKLAVHLTGTVLFSFTILDWAKDIFSKQELGYSDWSRYGTSPEFGHIYFLFIILIFLHMLDRQVEYVCRLDFIWKQKLLAEEEEARIMGLVNRMLLTNILPVHVANHFLDQESFFEDLYCEDYTNVAVMFASVPEYTDFYTENMLNEQGRRCLQVLNEIICDFDELLYVPAFAKIEKIKTIGSTYMAAAGLQPGRGSQEVNIEEEDPEWNAIVLVKFATAMMDKLAQLNRDTQQDFRLRIGIALGPVIAGVVGTSKPQYDIWGDTVNTASRMDSTGIIGRIHVTKEVASILMNVESSHFECECRGDIFVKGKGMLTTYLVQTSFDIPHLETTRL